jgi:hypothetical protein
MQRGHRPVPNIGSLVPPAGEPLQMPAPLRFFYDGTLTTPLWPRARNAL